MSIIINDINRIPVRRDGQVPLTVGSTISGGGIASSGGTSGGGDVYRSGIPSDNQIAVWTDGTHIEGTASLIYDGSTMIISGKTLIGDGVGVSSARVLEVMNNDGYSGIYSQGSLEFAPGKSIFMGDTSDSQPRMRLIQISSGIDIGGYIDVDPHLHFRIGSPPAIKMVLDVTGFTMDVDLLVHNSAYISTYLKVTGTTTLYGQSILSGNSTLVQNFSSPIYFSGFAGSGFQLMQIPGGDNTLTVDNLVVRKGMNVYELIINKIRATNGSLWVSDSAKLSAVTYSAPTYHCTIDTVAGDLIVPFVLNDLVRCQHWDKVYNTLKYYTAQVTGVDAGGTWFECQVIDGAGTPQEKDDVIRIGNTTNTGRQGSLYLTSNDVGNPFMDIMDGVNTASFSNKTKVRIGNLVGINDIDFGGSLSGYGLYCQNIFAKGQIQIASGSGGYNNLSDKPTLGSLASLNTADWTTNVTGKPGYTGPATGHGLFMNDSYLGYYDYDNYPSDPWRAYISSAGTARFTNVTEFGTQPSSGYLGYTTNVAVKGPDIYEPQYAGESALRINEYGYQGGHTYARSVYFGDGTGNSVGIINSMTHWGSYNYGRTIWYQEMDLDEGLYVGGYFRQGDHSLDPYASIGVAHGINVGSGNDTSRFQGTVDFYGYNSNFFYSERVMSINATDMYVNKPLTVHNTIEFQNNITATGTSVHTIQFNGGHNQVTSANDDTCAVAESDISGFSLSVTPKGSSVLVMFFAPFHCTSTDAGFWLSINSAGSNVTVAYNNVHTGSQIISMQQMVTGLTPNSAVTIKMRWSGTTAIQYLGSTYTYGRGTLTVTDLYD